MSSPIPRILSEGTHVKLDFADKPYCFSAEEASGFIRGLQISADKASLQFKEVVVCRSIIFVNPDDSIRLEQGIWCHKGPFTSEHFLAMIKYKEGISNEDWHKHLNDSSRVTRLC